MLQMNKKLKIKKKKLTIRKNAFGVLSAIFVFDKKKDGAASPHLSAQVRTRKMMDTTYYVTQLPFSSSKKTGVSTFSKKKSTVPCFFVEKTRESRETFGFTTGKNLKQYSYLEKEKGRLATKRLESVSNILDYYRDLELSGEYQSITERILNGIYKKNVEFAKGIRPLKKTQKILQIISKPETLLLAYKRLKGNRGALVKGATLDKHTFDNYNPAQKRVYYTKKIFPDGFSLRDVYNAGFLILKGDYP